MDKRVPLGYNIPHFWHHIQYPNPVPQPFSSPQQAWPPSAVQEERQGAYWNWNCKGHHTQQYPRTFPLATFKNMLLNVFINLKLLSLVLHKLTNLDLSEETQTLKIKKINIHQKLLLTNSQNLALDNDFSVLYSISTHWVLQQVLAHIWALKND